MQLSSPLPSESLDLSRPPTRSRPPPPAPPTAPPVDVDSAAGVGIWGVYWVVLGIYKIYTFNMYLDVYEAKLTPFQKRKMKDSVSSTSNIEATMRYRDAKMRTMSQEQAAEFYLSTNRIINSTTNSSTLGFINSKMTLMTPNQRIDYLRGKK
jgi:hypothetical protein